MHPQAECAGGAADLGDGLGSEAWVFGVLDDLLESGVGDVVLVEVFDLGEEAGVVELQLGLLPRGRLIHDRHDGSHRLHHQVGRLRVGLDLRDGLLVQLLKRIDGRFEGRHGLGEIATGVVGKDLGLCFLLADPLAVRLNLFLLFVGRHAFLDNDDEQVLALLLFLGDDVLLLLEVHSHLLHLDARLRQLVQTVPQLIGHLPDLCVLLNQQRHVPLDEL
mmetsp:Transcript_46016/g.114431  ORF Transcript_46016/g.114431 Transcript_46016/m.114431 type:complete len:219 (-) Transcript_46016:188-844(-)